MTHNINAVTGKQKAKYSQVFDSAVKAGLHKTNGMRIPNIPKTKLMEVTKADGAPLTHQEMFPKTLKEQQKSLTKKGQVSIKISKPKMTIGGFQVDKKDVEKKQKLEE